MAITSFRVGKGGTSQNITPYSTGAMAYKLVTWPTVLNDTTGGFNSGLGRWVAPSAGIFLSGWQVWDQAGTENLQSQNPGFTAKMYKNGAELVAGIGDIGSFPNTSSQQGSVADPCTAGTYYEIWNHATPDVLDVASIVTIDGNNAHTWWWGVFIPSGT